MQEPASGRSRDDEWAEGRRLRLLRRRRLIAAIALLGIIVLIALSIFERTNSSDSPHDGGTIAPPGNASVPHHAGSASSASPAA